MIKSMRRPGFTMIEMLIVIALIGTLFAFIGPRLMRYMTQAEESEIKLKFAAIKEALMTYRLELGTYPSTREGLKALVQNPRPSDQAYTSKARKWPFVEEDKIRDKRGEEFIYHSPAEKLKGKQFEIIWVGEKGTEDDPQLIEGA